MVRSTRRVQDLGPLARERAYVVSTPATLGAEGIVAATALAESGSESYAAFNPSDAGMGISFGRFQFNQGHRSLGALFARMYAEEPALLVELTYGDTPANKDPDALLRRLIQQLSSTSTSLSGSLAAGLTSRAWRARFERIGNEPRLRHVQDELAAERYLEPARDLCREFGLTSERALALLFDLCVQHGTGGAHHIVKGTFADNPKNVAEMKAAKDPNRAAEEHDLLVLIAKRSERFVAQRYLDGLVRRRRDILRDPKLSDAASPLATPKAVAGVQLQRRVEGPQNFRFGPYGPPA